MKNEVRSVMSMNPREREVRVKQEGMITSHWSSHKNPRIVRVSRGFGGKDRHSKVRTVRGLRDRRIRLSVPTAIQIYDLQHKLGLSQPSKALDWLLDNTKNDIDKLPPLPIIPAESSPPPPPPPPADHTQLQSSLSIHPPYIKDNGQRREKDKWIHHENHEGFGAQLLSAQNFFQSSIPYYNPYYNLPNLSLSHIGGAHPLPEYQSTSQLYFHPTATTIPPIIPTFPSKSLHPHQNHDTPRSGKEG